MMQIYMCNFSDMLLSTNEPRAVIVVLESILIIGAEILRSLIQVTLQHVVRVHCKSKLKFREKKKRGKCVRLGFEPGHSL